MTMEKLKTIQEAIEAKARKRAEDDISSVLLGFRLISESQALKHIHLQVDGQSKSLREAFWWKDRTLPKAVIDELTEKYLSEEVDKFVNDVERIKADIDNLYNQSQSYRGKP